MTTPDIHALAGAYALDAVDDVERAAFAKHLRECGACTAEVAELREAAARLADGTWSVPPPRLRDMVLAQARSTRQLAPGGSQPEQENPADAVWRWRRVTAAAASVAILATGAGAVSYTIQQERIRDQRAVADAARAENARLRGLLAAPDVTVRTGVLAGGGRVTVLMSARSDEGMAMLAGAPDPPGDRVYQLWLVDGAKPVAAGLMTSGSGMAPLAPVRGMTQFAVTVEPAGGSPAPTSKPILGISLT